MIESMPPYRPKSFESKWQKFWEERGLHRARDFAAPPQKKLYVLDMFPYPSGDGLHVGHVEGYTATDVLSRYFRRRGYNVLHPMGWDAFGLPAENYAIKNKIHPRLAVDKNIARFKTQLQSLGFSYDWSREINTTDPEYYRWTQWIFLQLFREGLAYQADVLINFCPKDKTGLADEEVVNGECERCHTKVERRTMRQWLLKITAYADRLLKDLEELAWPEQIKAMQRNWIGRSEGTEIKFQIQSASRRTEFQIPVFTTRPDTLFGATYVVIAPEHPVISKMIRQLADQIPASPAGGSNLKDVTNYIERAKQKSELERKAEAKEKTGVMLKGISAVNPINNEALPVFVADYVLMSYGTGAIMAVPAHDERDFAFAKKFKLPIRSVISPDGKPKNRLTHAYTADGILVRSNEFSGLFSEDAKERIASWLAQKGLADKKVQYKLRDWVFSRQRYWGEPIPLIFCSKCKIRAEKSRPAEAGRGSPKAAKIKNTEFNKGELLNPGWMAVPEAELPVLLPDVKSYEPTGTGESPLASMKEWVETRCPRCQGKARRETHTMPQWAGSCWYYLAYLLLNKNVKIKNKKLGDADVKKLFSYWLPVDIYVGGAEHAVLHLLYARFWHKFLFDIGVAPIAEPFQKLFNQGMILGPDGRRMSKSRGNVINPEEIYESYGADTIRMYELFMGPLEDTKPWDPNGIVGLYRFLKRVWEFASEKSKISPSPRLRRTDKIQKHAKKNDQDLERLRHKTIKKVTEDIEGFRFNTAISALMEYLNKIQSSKSKVQNIHIETLLLMLAPFAPHTTEELWQTVLKKEKSIHEEPWPRFDAARLREEKVVVIVQVNGKVRGQIICPSGISEGEATAKAMELSNAKRALSDGKVSRVVFVKDRLINLVTQE